MKNQMIRNMLVTVAILGLLIAAGSAVASPTKEGEVNVAAEVSESMYYQGLLTDGSGNPLTGTYDLTFEFYDDPLAGTKVWETTEHGVPVQGGLFDAQLHVPGVFEGQGVWLAIRVDGELLTPRQEVLPVPYALSLRPGAVVRGAMWGTESIIEVHNEGDGRAVAGYGNDGVGVWGESENETAVVGWIRNPDNPNATVAGLHEGDGRAVAGYATGGVGVYGHSDHHIGVEGETDDDTPWEAAGVRGFSVHDQTFGVLGDSEWGIGVEGRILNPDNHNPAVVGYNEGGGPGVWGESDTDVGVYGRSHYNFGVEGETDEDTPWESAGVRGFSQHAETFGVLGESEWGFAVRGLINNPDNFSDAVSGLTYGTGSGVFGYSSNGRGVEGHSTNSAGVVGWTEAPGEYGGVFLNDAGGGAGVYAAGGDDDTADLVLGGEPDADDGIISSAPDQPGSDIILASNDAVAVILDSNDDEDGHLTVWNGTEDKVFQINEAGDVEITGDLTVAGYVNTRGPTSVKHDVTEPGQWIIDVPDFCIDGMCSVFIWTDGTVGAFGPGLLWPVYYTQSSADDSWIGGPNLFIAGVGHSDGVGVNGDANFDRVFIGVGSETGGPVVQVLDDSYAEDSPYLWTINFNPVPGEFTQASIIICPYGSPVAP